MVGLETLYEKLGYPFKQPRLLIVALTHCSVSDENNERLEFLGDSVIDLVVTEAIYEKFPKAAEGQMSRLRAALVKGDTLAEIAKSLDLGSYVQLGPGELKSGGFRRTSILADALEAVVAAVYLDSDWAQARQVVLSLYQQRLAKASIDQHYKDPKTQLQEYAQSKKLALPVYKVVEVSGIPHAQTFYVDCTVDGLSYAAQGSGSSRRRAEQHAAENFLSLVTEK